MDETHYRSGWDGAMARHLAVNQAPFGARQVRSLPHPPKRGGAGIILPSSPNGRATDF